MQALVILNASQWSQGAPCGEAEGATTVGVEAGELAVKGGVATAGEVICEDARLHDEGTHT